MNAGILGFVRRQNFVLPHAPPLFGVWPWPIEKKRVTHPLSTAFIDALCALLGPAHVAAGESDGVGDGGSKLHPREAGAVVYPATTDEVADVVRLCAQYRVAVLPKSGRSGRGSAGVSQPGEVVLSLSRMNHIEAIDPQARVAVVGAGCTLAALQEAAAALQLEPGIDLAARGSATLGGMVSANTGGVMAFRNGVMRHRVLGLEAVLPDSSVFQDLTWAGKKTAGTELRHLFIGAEGTLGVITRIVLKLDPLPQVTNTVLLGLPSVEATLDVIGRALQMEVGHVRAAEALWQGLMRLNAQALHWSDAAMPLDQPLYLLLKIGGARHDALQTGLEQLVADTRLRYPSTTDIIASSAPQEAALWHLREATDIVYRAHPHAPSFEVSVPLWNIPAYVARIQAELAALDPNLQPYLFGHLADGNLHIILNERGPLASARARVVEHVLYRNLQALGGSFSAEHGVCVKRLGALNETPDDTKDDSKRALLEKIKKLLDATGVKNRGNLIRD